MPRRGTATRSGRIRAHRPVSRTRLSTMPPGLRRSPERCKPWSGPPQSSLVLLALLALLVDGASHRVVLTIRRPAGRVRSVLGAVFRRGLPTIAAPPALGRVDVQPAGGHVPRRDRDVGRDLPPADLHGVGAAGVEAASARGGGPARRRTASGQ